MSEAPLLEFEPHPPLVVGHVRAISVLDALNVSKFGADLMAYAAANPALHLLLDFNEVTYLSSAVLTELLRVQKRVKEEKGDLRLCGLNPDIRKVFEITNLDQMIIIYDNVHNGVKKYARSLTIELEEETWDQLNKGM